MQHRGQQQTHNSQQRADTMGMEVLGEAGDGDQGGGIHHQTCVLQADESNKQTDAYGNAPLEGKGNGIEDRLTHIRQGEGNENKTFREHRQQRDLPRIAHAQYHGVGQIRIEAHAGGQNEGQIRHKCHASRADKGRNGRGQQNRCGIHSGIPENAGVHRQNIRHGHKCCDACHHFCFDRCVVLLQFEYFLQHT